MGFKNYTQIVNDLTFDTVQAGINVISVSDTEDDISSGIDKVCKTSQVEAQVLNNRHHHQSGLMIFRLVEQPFPVRWSK